ncbi:MAG TPA: ATP-binding protein [Gammaproteobacteria bacterium]|nr:ATP-binding protein [Gammaproteobacteria bacterium]
MLTSLCLRYLLLLRTFVMGVQIAALVAAHLLLHAPLPWLPITTVLITLAVITALSWRIVSTRRPVAESEVLLQLCIDIAALTTLLYFTGGSWNPFVSLFLLPITVAAATLRPAYTWMLVVCAAVSYTTLMFFHQHTLHWVHDDDHFSPHVWGMWFGFLLSAAVIAFFVARIGATLRTHDRELAQARQWLALGSLAAGTCHELGTPLSTMAVLAKDLQQERENDPKLVNGLRVLRGQIDRCKDILSRMSARTGQAQALSGGRMDIDRYLTQLIGEWRALRPGHEISVHLHGMQPPPCIIADRTLSQAIVNILHNAADASPGRVEIEGRWNGQELKVLVRDEGGGLPPGVAERIGRDFVTTKPQGMGMGLHLAHLALKRIGGELVLRDRDSGLGVIAEISLPLAPLLA